MSSLYETCAYETEGGGSDLLIQCIAEGLEKSSAESTSSYLSWLLVLCGALIFFMQVGPRKSIE